jgi:hypothetical protein
MSQFLGVATHSLQNVTWLHLNVTRSCSKRNLLYLVQPSLTSVWSIPTLAGGVGIATIIWYCYGALARLLPTIRWPAPIISHFFLPPNFICETPPKSDPKNSVFSSFSRGVSQSAVSGVVSHAPGYKYAVVKVRHDRLYISTFRPF